MKTVILYGELAKRFGKTHQFDVATIGESVRAMKANFAGFEAFMNKAHLDGFGFRLLVGENPLNKDEELELPTGQAEVFKIVPVVMGSGGFGKIFLGALLVVGGLLITGATFGGATALGGAIAGAGIGMIIGGISQLLTNPPKLPEATTADDKASYLFNGPANTTAQGGSVPVGYGRLMIGSIVISAGIETQ